MSNSSKIYAVVPHPARTRGHEAGRALANMPGGAAGRVALNAMEAAAPSPAPRRHAMGRITACAGRNPWEDTEARLRKENVAFNAVARSQARFARPRA